MNIFFRKISFFIAVVFISIFTSINTFADADIAVQPAGTQLQTQANVDFRIIVPRILIFGIGPANNDITRAIWTGSLNTGIANFQTWTEAGPFNTAGNNPFSSLDFNASVETAGTGTATGNTVEASVYLFSNSGEDITISVHSFEGNIGGGGNANVLQTISGSEISNSTITVASSNNNLEHPNNGSLITGGTASTITAGNNVINESGTWSYNFSPDTVAPLAGQYDARVTYLAASP